MPEILRQSPEVQAAKDRLYAWDDFVERNHQGEYMPYKEVVAIRQSLGVLGAGSDYLVIPGAMNPQKLEAHKFYPLDGSRARFIYHTHRILSILFPHNFPRFYSVQGANVSEAIESGISEFSLSTGSVRQRIQGRTPEYPKGFYGYSEDLIGRMRGKINRIRRGENDVKYPLSKAKEIWKSLGFEPILEGHSGNVMIGEDGGEYYVDTVHKTLSDFNPKLTLEYMETHGYGPELIRQVSESLARIAVAREELGHAPDLLNYNEVITMTIGGPTI